MFGPPGHVYVYRSYGIHWCLNVVCREAGHGAGVLIRALEPIAGIETMRLRRGVSGRSLPNERLLCAGPGRVGQALGLGPQHDGLRVDRAPFEFVPSPTAAPLLVGARIGISKAVDKPWRFGMAGSPFLSRPFR
jgi:DNA-3-methyladenine glycosylase